MKAQNFKISKPAEDESRKVAYEITSSVAKLAMFPVAYVLFSQTERSKVIRNDLISCAATTAIGVATSVGGVGEVVLTLGAARCGINLLSDVMIFDDKANSDIHKVTNLIDPLGYLSFFGAHAAGYGEHAFVAAEIGVAVTDLISVGRTRSPTKSEFWVELGSNSSSAYVSATGAWQSIRERIDQVQSKSSAERGDLQDSAPPPLKPGREFKSTRM